MTTELFHHLSNIYTTMDKRWDATAARYGFRCEGCEDNCCTSLFFHHSFIEKAFLLHGFEQLAPNIKETAIAEAKTYYTKTLTQGNTASKKMMCPLNQEGKCLIYTHRPMICRLHGLPHELHKPGSALFKGAGCHAGFFEEHPYFPFDRTPFYKEMAAIEIQFRRETGKTGKIKETVAQMLLF